jgi:hypothetical protein
MVSVIVPLPEVIEAAPKEFTAPMAELFSMVTGLL